MYCTKNISDSVIWVGANDRRLNLFENLFPIPRGVSYNAYVILDDKTALMDTADFSVSRQFMENVEHALAGRSLDYLVINHMEPDHCASIEAIIQRYPQVQVVGNVKTIQYIGQFFGARLPQERSLQVAEGDKLFLGRHELTFVMAPMVHWPEVMMAYESSEKILFSADAFGTFGTLDGIIFNDEVDFDRDFLDDARRYYTNIVGKYGVQVQAVLKKAAALDISMFCPLHGPVWRSDLGYFLDKHDKWSKYEPEDKAVAIFYGSMYGHTAAAAECMANALSEAGVKSIRIYDVSVTHVSYLIAEAFRCSHLVFAAPTYNGGIYPVMESLLTDMKALNLQNRTVAILENGTWGATAGRQMKALFEQMKDMRLIDEPLSIKSSLTAEQADDLAVLAKKIAADM